MEEGDTINLQGAYENLKQEMPVPWKAECTDCGTDLITQLDTSYLEERDDAIKVFRPSYCNECMEINGLYVKVIAEVKKDGKIYPKNQEGPVK